MKIQTCIMYGGICILGQVSIGQPSLHIVRGPTEAVCRLDGVVVMHCNLGSIPVRVEFVWSIQVPFFIILPALVFA